MSRTNESGAYLGGIGAMLEVTDVCAACGQVHSDRQFGFKHRSLRECPLVVVGSFPVVSLPNPPAEAPIHIPAARRIREAEQPIGPLPVFEGPFASPRVDHDRVRGRALGVPWLAPPDLGEVL
ncbi:MAG: hypothetical protein WB786_00085 [Thermoplasmata archaeon]